MKPDAPRGDLSVLQARGLGGDDALGVRCER